MEAQTSARYQIARYRAAQRERGLRPVVRLPDVSDSEYGRALLTIAAVSQG
jgi:hypothetical protein